MRGGSGGLPIVNRSEQIQNIEQFGRAADRLRLARDKIRQEDFVLLRLCGELPGLIQEPLPGLFIAANRGIDHGPQPADAGFVGRELFGFAELLEHVVPLLQLAVDTRPSRFGLRNSPSRRRRVAERLSASPTGDAGIEPWAGPRVRLSFARRICLAPAASRRSVVSAVFRSFASKVVDFLAHHEPPTSTKSENLVTPVDLPSTNCSAWSTTCRAVSIK